MILQISFVLLVSLVTIHYRLFGFVLVKRLFLRNVQNSVGHLSIYKPYAYYPDGYSEYAVCL
jgi:hypothetical protein